MVIAVDERGRARLYSLGEVLSAELGFCERLEASESYILVQYRDSGLLDDCSPLLDSLGQWVGVFARRYGRKLPAFAIYTVYELMKAGLIKEDIEGYFSSQETYRVNVPFMRLLGKSIEAGSGEYKSAMRLMTDQSRNFQLL